MGVGGWGELYPVLFWIFGILFNFKVPNVVQIPCWWSFKTDIKIDKKFNQKSHSHSLSLIYLARCRDGGYEDSPLIGRYCETTIDRTIRSHSNRLYLKMETDNTVTDRGFRIYYDATMSGKIFVTLHIHINILSTNLLLWIKRKSNCTSVQLSC